MITDYEDDTHFCIKCHSTILGLDNYVTHRKTGCAKNIDEPPKSPLPSQLLPPDESFSLKADDFFSSLELQSSNKKSVPPTTSGNRNLSGILTRSKTTAVIQATNVTKDTVQQEIQQSKSGKNAWIGGHQLKELGSGDNQTRLIKAVDNLSRNSIKKYEPQRLNIYEESDDNSDEYDYDDDSDDDENNEILPRSFTGAKWKPSSPVQWIKNDRDWHVPPPQHTGGKWKPNVTHKTRQQSPPPNYTKGKWKPSSPHSLNRDCFDIPPPTFTGGKWSQSKFVTKIDCSEASTLTNLKGKCKSNVHVDVNNKSKLKVNKNFNYPPPEYTKGKWKPQSSVVLKDKTIFSLPANYTKGKWKPEALSETEKWRTSNVSQEVLSNTAKWNLKNKNDDNNKSCSILNTDEPPFRKSSGTVQYWCRPCNRRLASKIVYERHLKSELHFKRTLHDTEFDDSSHLNSNLIKENKRTIKRRPLEYWQCFENHKDVAKTLAKTRRRFRRKLYVKCEVCRSKVNSQLMGKHLISHYHYRKGDITSPEAIKMVLENIYNIVLQAPYQCASCKFYCNTQQYFLLHWQSEEHKLNDQKGEGDYFCSFCKYMSRDTTTMLNHLTSNEHNDVIAVINRSVPIVIKKVRHIVCQDCNKQFLLNIQLRKHCEKSGHFYQNYNTCTNCNFVLPSKISLQRHKQHVHGEIYYTCTICNLNFNSALEAKLHRKTSEHRYSVVCKKINNVATTKDTRRRKCDYCLQEFENFLILKRHLQDNHPQHYTSCAQCGKKFTIPQDLAVHIRTKSCSITNVLGKRNSCNQCAFTTNSPSEILFHKILHSEPLLVYGDETRAEISSKRPIQQYKCSVCEKFFSRASLRCHIRMHTKERPFICMYCNASFIRKNNWIFHVKKHRKNENNTVIHEQKSNGLSGERPFLCCTCGATFKRKSVLQQHMTRHSGKQYKCPHSGCVYKARKLADLKPHMLTHLDIKPYNCELCNYKGKTKQQLQRHKTVHDKTKKYQCSKCPFVARLSSHVKRHMRLHTGAKPFACPHCEYRCNNLENLRKHILSTNKHPGKCIYECKFCSNNSGESNFQTNFAKEFKVHLVTNHAETLENGTKATTYVGGIYEVLEDSAILDKIGTDADCEECNNPVELLDKIKMPLHNFRADPLESCSTSNPINSTLLTSVSKQDIVVENKNLELFPTFILAKDIVCVENSSDSRYMVGSYDVEESGALVPFQSSEETFFQGHFE